MAPACLTARRALRGWCALSAPTAWHWTLSLADCDDFRLRHRADDYNDFAANGGRPPSNWVRISSSLASPALRGTRIRPRWRPVGLAPAYPADIRHGGPARKARRKQARLQVADGFLERCDAPIVGCRQPSRVRVIRFDAVEAWGRPGDTVRKVEQPLPRSDAQSLNPTAEDFLAKAPPQRGQFGVGQSP